MFLLLMLCFVYSENDDENEWLEKRKGKATVAIGSWSLLAFKFLNMYFEHAAY